MESLAVLYSKTKSQKIKTWKICVFNKEKQSSVIRISSGFVDGSQTVFDSVVKTGKNIGRSNETTHFSQAVLEAKSKWNKKKDNGYTENVDGEVDYVSPMLAVDYFERKNDVMFPCYVQHKLDGIRAVYVDGDLFSRKSKIFQNLDFILDEIKKFEKDVKLDGELYSHTLPFNQLSGILRKQKLTKEDKAMLVSQVKYVIYDTVSDADYSERLSSIKKVFKANKFKHLELINFQVAKSLEELPEIHTKYVKDGYEGVIIRNFLGPYQQKTRSKNLQKFKKFIDSEFEIVSFTEGSGIEEGLVLWICKVPGTDKTFTVRPTGTHSERMKLFKNGKKYIGKNLTVKYFELFEGVPRFPIGVAVRDYE